MSTVNDEIRRFNSMRFERKDKDDLENEFEIKTLNEEYLNSLVLGFNIDLNKEIEKLLNNEWKIERISAVDKAILFAGIIELNLYNNLTNNIIIS